MLAPGNTGVFSLNEHVGHITKEFVTGCAPIIIIDDLSLVKIISFTLILLYTDTNHTRVGYDVESDVEVVSSN